METHLAGRLLAEDAVLREDMIVEVGIQGAAEALGEGDSRQLGALAWGPEWMPRSARRPQRSG
jgi:hypothetical protein